MTAPYIAPQTIAKINPAAIERPLSIILAELMLAEGESKRLFDRAHGRDFTEIEDKRTDVLDDTIYARRAEAKAAIERLTGVSWDMIEGALN